MLRFSRFPWLIPVYMSMIKCMDVERIAVADMLPTFKSVMFYRGAI